MEDSRTRLFFARVHLTWSGTIAAVWQVAFVIVVGTQASGTVVHRNLYSGMLAVALLWSSGCFWFNSLFWGPTAGTRKGLGWSEACRKLSSETEVSYEKRLSRLIRCYGDQALHAWIVGSSAYTMIFLLNFYWHNGIHDFLLLPGYTLGELLQFLTMQKFYSIQAGIGGIAVAIVMVTVILDAFKRFVLSIGMAPAVHVADGTTATGSQQNGDQYLYSSNTGVLTGNLNPK